ncbi:MAG: hypothetical protein NC082_07980 [Clostridiales bacterium]|nr:hypothetical protein [Clostridiales bacterium]
MKVISTWWHDLLSIIFPNVCEICGRQLIDGETLLCTHCDVNMPRTSFHRDSFNTMHQRLVGTIKVERAAAWFEYRRGSQYSQLILNAKYHDRPEIAQAIGHRYASEIISSGFFNDIDIILPVPMHWRKRLKRGYNQSMELAKGVSEVTNIPIGDNLKMLYSHATQTRRSAYERYRNVEGLFDVERPTELKGKHLLLVDDVLTTGSTMLSCIMSLAAAVPQIRVSVLTAASTSQ